MDADVAALAPLVFTVDVPCTPGTAFRYFTEDIGQWWPLVRHSVGRDASKTCAFEPRIGGRLVERTRDGEEHTWGTVTQWDAPRQLAFTWHPGRDAASAQIVTVQFEAVGAGTRVTLTHDGWSALRERAGAARDEYNRGWQGVIRECFGGYARRAAGATA